MVNLFAFSWQRNIGIISPIMFGAIDLTAASFS